MTDEIVNIQPNVKGRVKNIPVRSNPKFLDVRQMLSAGTPEALGKYLEEKNRVYLEWKEQRFRICALCGKTKKRTEFIGESKYCNSCKIDYHGHKKRERSVKRYKYIREGKGLTMWCAKQIVYNLKKMGLIFQNPCEICGNKKSISHHDDYNFPWLVRWLCLQHHREWHKNNEAKYV